MIRWFKKSVFLSFPLMLISGCMSKNNGKYHTKYSYHPYYDLYANKMSGKTPKSNSLAKTGKIPHVKEKKEAKVSLKNKIRYPGSKATP